MNAKNVLSSPLRYLDKALNGLRDLGLMPQKPDEMPVITLINQISDLDEEKTIAIARTLSNTTVFNEVVREQITAMNVGERYETITKSFDSIRDDAKSMVEQLDDGKIDTMERLSNFWMKMTRGDIPSRFNKIKKTYLEVSADTKDQINDLAKNLANLAPQASNLTNELGGLEDKMKDLLPKSGGILDKIGNLLGLKKPLADYVPKIPGTGILDKIKDFFGKGKKLKEKSLRRRSN